MVTKKTDPPVESMSPNAANEVLAEHILTAINKVRHLLVIMTVIVFISMAVISTSAILTNRVQTDAKEISSQNHRFLENFSNYMRCLIVNEEDVVIAVGEENYLNLCDKLLFLGTGQTPHVVKVTIPPELTSTTTTTVLPATPTSTP
jgi:hypothetical protein